MGRGLPDLLQCYVGGKVSRDPKFVLRNIWTAPIPKRAKIDPRGLKVLFMYTKSDFWSKIFADNKGTPFSYFAFRWSVNFFCDMFFAACIKYKDSVLCRQPDKNVTFATMVHKYPEKSGGRKRPPPQGKIFHLQTNIDVFNLRIC